MQNCDPLIRYDRKSSIIPLKLRRRPDASSCVSVERPCDETSHCKLHSCTVSPLHTKTRGKDVKSCHHHSNHYLSHQLAKTKGEDFKSCHHHSNHYLSHLQTKTKCEDFKSCHHHSNHYLSHLPQRQKAKTLKAAKIKVPQ